MLHIEGRLTLDERTISTANLAGRFSDEDLKRIGAWCYDGYDRDKRSGYIWERRSQAALDLAMQVVVDKTFPWPGAANVAFPLVTIAAMQFHARAYPAIINGSDLVKYRIAGGMPTPDEKEAGERVSDIMNKQLLEDDSHWEEQEDRLLLVSAIMGTAFKKSYYDADAQRTVSELVMPTDLVLDHRAKSVEACPRKTHCVPMYRNEIYERVQKGLFKDVLEDTWYCNPSAIPATDTSIAQDKRMGIQDAIPDENTPFLMMEQHCWADFDGDGYAEPYIITFELNSRCVVRIVSRVDRKEDIERKPSGQIIRITPTEYFTKRGFIPSPDGGIMDIGFGILLGPINESVSTVINQLLDQGTMLTTGGGFLGRGAKIRGGSFTFAPNQWIRVDASGDDLAKSIVQNPVREPSNVLFQLLGLLIEYSNRISSATDMMVGENPGQNTPAQTSQSMIEQGMKLYSAIFKRQWRGLKEEFKKVFRLNAVYLPTNERQWFLGDPNRIVPAADPNIVSDNHKLQQAMTVKQAAMSTPGYDLQAVENFFLDALRVDEKQILYPKDKSQIPPLPNPKMQVEQMKMQVKQAELKQKQMQFILQLQDQAKLTQAKIIELQARAMKEVAEAKGVQTGHQIAAFEATLGLLKAHDESLRGHIELAMKGLEDGQGGAMGGGLPGMETPPGNQSPMGLPGMGA